MDIRLSAAFRSLSNVLAGTVLISAVLLPSMLLPSMVRAQGTEEERRACTPDVMQLCREFIPNVAAITQCLIDKRRELSPACRLVMTAPNAEPVRRATTRAKKRPAAARHAEPTAAKAKTKPGAKPSPRATAGKPKPTP